MTDLQIAKDNLNSHSVCFAKSEEIILLDGRGVAPILAIIDEKDLKGFSVADKIVGKAAAMLFSKIGVASVFGKVMSKAGKKFLESRNIPYEYETLVEKIMNKDGTDICPMEKTVQQIDNENGAYVALKNKVLEMRTKR